jgi:hypothetical protein
MKKGNGKLKRDDAEQELVRKAASEFGRRGARAGWARFATAEERSAEVSRRQRKRWRNHREDLAAAEQLDSKLGIRESTPEK